MAVPLLDKEIIKKRVNKFKRPQIDLFVSVKGRNQWENRQTGAGPIHFYGRHYWFVTINLCPGESGHIVQKFLTIYPRRGKKLWNAWLRSMSLVTNKLARLRSQEDE